MRLTIKKLQLTNRALLNELCEERRLKARAEYERDLAVSFIRKMFNWFADLADTAQRPKISHILKEFARALGAK